MGTLNLIILAIGLAMDAFAVSICKGLSLPKMDWKKAVIAGLYFGGFQALMPLLGYLAGERFDHLISSIDHWIAFGLLLIIGGKMIIESFEKDKKLDASFGFRSMIVLAIATSIDALAVGITFAFLQTNIWIAITHIGIITFIFSAAGVKIGNAFGSKWGSKAEFVGGVILVGIGVKILVEHLVAA